MRSPLILLLVAALPAVASAGWPFHHHRHHQGAYAAQMPVYQSAYMAQAPAYYMPQPAAFAQAAPGPQAGIVDIGTILTIIDRLQPRVVDLLDRRHERIKGDNNHASDDSNQSLMDRLSKLEDSMKSSAVDTRDRIDNLTNITQSLGKQLVRISSRLDRRDVGSDDAADSSGISKADVDSSLDTISLRVSARALEEGLRDLQDELGDSGSARMRALLTRAINDAHRIYAGDSERSNTRSRRRDSARGNSWDDDRDSSNERADESSTDDMTESNRSYRYRRSRFGNQGFDTEEGSGNRVDVPADSNIDE